MLGRAGTAMNAGMCIEFSLRGKCLVPCQTSSLAPQFLVNERTALSNRSTQATECTYRRERRWHRRPFSCHWFPHSNSFFHSVLVAAAAIHVACMRRAMPRWLCLLRATYHHPCTEQLFVHLYRHVRHGIEQAKQSAVGARRPCHCHARGMLCT